MGIYITIYINHFSEPRVIYDEYPNPTVREAYER